MLIIKRVESTNATNKTIELLKDKHGKDLLFHLSGGCCDGSSPMCFEVGDFMLGSRDVKLGEIHGCEFYTSPEQYEYLKGTHITIDVKSGRGAGFSIETSLGLSFIMTSRLFTSQEITTLENSE